MILNSGHSYKAIFSLLVLLIILNSCFRKPEFDNIPNITFNRIDRFNNDVGLIRQDSIVISIDFQDGDGDLGLTSEDRQLRRPPFDPSPYQEFIFDGNTPPLDSTRNEFFFNYFIDIFKKEGERFVPVSFPDPEFTFNGAFPPLFEEENRVGPLEGTLRYGILVLESTTFQANDTLMFQIQIADRALQKSNIIESDTVVILRD